MSERLVLPEATGHGLLVQEPLPSSGSGEALGSSIESSEGRMSAVCLCRPLKPPPGTFEFPHSFLDFRSSACVLSSSVGSVWAAHSLVFSRWVTTLTAPPVLSLMTCSMVKFVSRVSLTLTDTAQNGLLLNAHCVSVGFQSHSGGNRKHS